MVKPDDATDQMVFSPKSKQIQLQSKKYMQNPSLKLLNLEEQLLHDLHSNFIEKSKNIYSQSKSNFISIEVALVSQED